MSYQAILNYWTVQNTGWSGGVSWFDLPGAHGAARFDSEEKAREKIAATRSDDPEMRWRITHVCVLKAENQRITIESFCDVPA